MDLHEHATPRPADLYYNYMFGFHAGAGVKVIDKARAEHANAAMREAYARGWKDGRAKAHAASTRAGKLYGYKPSIIRAQGASTKGKT